jgi:tetratricopeptide (TPR) repeat protein
MRRISLFIGSLALISWLFLACSTEKNTLVNRTYHGLTAHYNGYFNANELIRQSLSTFRGSLKENYYQVLPIDALPDEEQVVGLYPAIDTAIVKCTKVIQRHSMPSNDRPSLKKEEHNQWIDENWTTIGIASFYRRDYDAAMKGFNFVKKFYSNDPSIYIADLWMAKTNIQLNKLTEAGFNLNALDKAVKDEQERSKEKKSAQNKNKSKKEEPVAEVPKSIYFELEKTKAELALKKQEPKEAIKFLESSLEFAKVKTDKSRVHYIIAQLNESTGNREEAKKHYTQCLKYNAPYEMHFNARLKRAFMGGDEKVRKELMKMLRDAKNAPFKDQIYFALADIELQKANEPKAVEFLTLSAFYSTANKRQKGMSYEKLGDLSFSHRNYVKAQKYYDSCATVIDDTYPNAEGVRNKASNLKDLVKAVETAAFEDSVQRIARLSEDDRSKFLEGVIKQIKEEEERRKKLEAEKLRELQQNQNNSAQSSGSGSKWYFNNPKTRGEGYDEFRKLWGTRENEDNWRRSDKTVLSIAKDNTDEDTATVADQKTDEKDTLTVESLLKNIPLTDSALAMSNKRLLESLYTAGLIYKEQLNEPVMARKQFESVRSKNTEGDIDLSSSFQLFKLLIAISDPISESEKEHILTVYPNSDYANYLRDPDFFVKRKEREALAEQEYLTVFERYKRGLYMPVISRADMVINQEKDNKYRSKYMLLKAMSMGQMTENKKELIPVLQQVVAEYPGTEEETRAKDMIKIINEGFSKNISVDRSNKSPFKFDENAPQWVLIFLDKGESSSTAKTKVSDFNREFFSRNALKVSSKIFGDDQSVILVQEFKDDVTASNYVRIYKSTRKHLLDLQKAKIMVITQENMKLLFENKLLQEYETFYDEFY